ncbi:MAG: hypothetical protein KDC27_10695 [Acidobacteria bacterium]|nr:hypothetical protein [Acidobacteriota bacterium]
MLTSYALGIGLILALMFGWAAVQTAWGKTFPDATDDADVLAHRIGCQGCGCTTVCQRKLGKTFTQEKTQ